MMDSYKRFQVELDGHVTVIRLIDSQLHEIILITELHDELLEYIEHHQPRNLLVDFAMVTQCSSAVINSMLRARRRVLEHGGCIRLCSMHGPVRAVFQTLCLDGTVFEIYESLPEALQAFS